MTELHCTYISADFTAHNLFEQFISPKKWRPIRKQFSCHTVVYTLYNTQS